MPINNFEYNDVLCSVISLQLLSEKKEKKRFYIYTLKFVTFMTQVSGFQKGGEPTDHQGFNFDVDFAESPAFFKIVQSSVWVL